jgi:hypothetical protein
VAQGPETGGARGATGPGLSPDREHARCARIRSIIAGSSWQPAAGHRHGAGPGCRPHAPRPPGPLGHPRAARPRPARPRRRDVGPPLSSALDAAPDTRRRCPGAAPPSARSLTTTPRRTTMAQAWRGDRVGHARLRLHEGAPPGSETRVRRGRRIPPAPGRTVRQSREERVSILCAARFPVYPPRAFQEREEPLCPSPVPRSRMSRRR